MLTGASGEPDEGENGVMEQKTTYDMPIWGTGKDRPGLKKPWDDRTWNMLIVVILLIVTLPLLPVLFCIGWVKQKLFPPTSAPLPNPEEQRNREERFRYEDECCIHMTRAGDRSDYRYTMPFDEWKAVREKVESGAVEALCANPRIRK